MRYLWVVLFICYTEGLIMDNKSEILGESNQALYLIIAGVAVVVFTVALNVQELKFMLGVG